jgi:hypothetical protein
MRRLLLSTCAVCTLGISTLGLLAAVGPASAGSPSTLPGTSYAVPVEQAADTGRPDFGNQAFWDDHRLGGAVSYDGGPESFLHEPNVAGADEIGELQRMFPSSAWPPSMRN